jgi:exosortase A
MNESWVTAANAPRADAGAAAGTERGRVCLVAGLIVAAFALLWPSTQALMLRWEDTVSRAYTHGWLVIAVALWMIWRSRAPLARVPAQPWYPALAALLAGSLAWLVAVRAGLQIVHELLVPLLAAVAVLAVFGWRVAWRLKLPLAYLLLAIPVWDVFLPLLQSVSLFAVQALLRLVGIPSYFSGNTFQIPEGGFEVADGCAGLHFFNVSIAIGLLYGEVNHDRLRTRVALVALAVAFALATNWVRIFIIAIAGHMTDMQHHLVAREHYSFGWALFAIAMVGYFLIVRRWPRTDPPPAAMTPAQPFTPSQRGALAVTLAIFSGAAAGWWLDENRAPESAVSRMLPGDIPGWERHDAAGTDWQPVFAGADARAAAVYAAGGERVEVFSAVFAEQLQGKEAVGYGTSLLGPGLVAVSPTTGAGEPWREIRARDAGGATWLIRHAYRLDDTWHGSALRLQLDYGWRSLARSPVVAVVAMRSVCAGDDCVGAAKALQQFAGRFERL